MLSEKQMSDRLGKFCASSIHQIMGKKAFGKSGESYVWQLIAERETGLNHENYQNEAMRWGEEHEAEAAMYYAAATDQEITQGDSIVTGEVCATPDYYIDGKKIGIEIKCPFVSAKHAQRLGWSSWEDLKNNYPECYWQIMTGFLLSGMEEWKFLSYDPRFIEARKKMVVVTIPKNEADIELLKSRISEGIKIMVDYGIDVSHDHVEFYKSLTEEKG
jgi:hypothetical protein